MGNSRQGNNCKNGGIKRPQSVYIKKNRDPTDSSSGNKMQLKVDLESGSVSLFAIMQKDVCVNGPILGPEECWDPQVDQWGCILSS